MNLSISQIQKNIKTLNRIIQELNADCLYVPSFDQFISEYVPLWNNLRFYVTGFTGSTADVLLIGGKAHLFVDGRYHLQADEEVECEDVVIHKCTNEERIFLKALDLANENNVKSFGVIPERTPISHAEMIQDNFETILVNESKFLEEIDFNQKTDFPTVQEIDSKLLGQNVKDRLKRCELLDNEALFLSAIDDVSWITNLRGYHLSFLSSFLSKAIVTKDQISLIVQENIKFNKHDDLIKVFTYKSNIDEVLHDLIKELDISSIKYDKNFSTLNDLEVLKKSNIQLEAGTGLTFIKNIKLSVEVPEYERIFNLGDQAIFDTIKWCKNEVQSNNEISELDLYKQTTISYQKYGSTEQSFNTISGAGEHGAIIHYSDPKSSRIINKNDLVLLDSGGYFESGLATDTTRTFLADENNIEHPMFNEYKKAYSLVVRAQIQAESAVFKKGTKGRSISMLARQPLYQEGLDYAHGLGHGVGVHVHEPGVRLSTVSDLPLYEGMVVSIEPGLYFDHKFGIRHENIVIVEKHPEFKGFLKFRTLVFIGLEEVLLDFDTFTPTELKYYNWYKSECEKRSRAFI